MACRSYRFFRFIGGKRLVRIYMCIGYNIQQPHNILFLRRGKTGSKSSLRARQDNQTRYFIDALYYTTIFECEISKSFDMIFAHETFFLIPKNSNALPSEIIKRHSIKVKSWKSLDTVFSKYIDHYPSPCLQEMYYLHLYSQFHSVPTQISSISKYYYKRRS